MLHPGFINESKFRGSLHFEILRTVVWRQTCRSFFLNCDFIEIQVFEVDALRNRISEQGHSFVAVIDLVPNCVSKYDTFDDIFTKVQKLGIILTDVLCLSQLVSHRIDFSKYKLWWKIMTFWNVAVTLCFYTAMKVQKWALYIKLGFTCWTCSKLQ